MNISPPSSSAPRPPTPPKERAIDQALDGFIQFLDDSSKLPVVSELPLDTPPPSSSPNLPSTFPQISVKSIRFVAQPSLIDSPSTDTTHLHAPSPLRPLPPSRYQRPRRSILKSCESSSSPPPSSDDAESSLANASLTDFDSFKDLFATACKGLACREYTVRINAYQLLLKSLRQSRHVPDPQAVLAELPFLESVLQQDMVAMSPATDGLDAKLISQATRLTANLIWDPKISFQLSSRFVDFVMDRSLEVAEAPKLPKEVFKNQLFLLSIDRLLSRALAPAKATKLIAALNTIPERVSGDHILSIRLTILRELARYAPATLAATANDWPAWVFEGIMSNSTEVRSIAISTGAALSTRLGAYKQVSHGIKDFFQCQATTSDTNFDLFYRFLEQMLLDADDAQRVPGIWSIVVLFLRGSSLCLASWTHLNQWFKVIQKCLNSVEVKLNMEAWVAWNNLIFAVNPSLTTPVYMRGILVKPIISKLQLHSKTDAARRNRQAAFSSFSLLLYYAFRPGCSSEHITLYWSTFVMDVVQNARMTSRSDVDRLCDILCALLSNSENPTWDVNRYAPSCVEPVRSQEIPRIDPAWTRSNIDVATEVVEYFVAMQLPLQVQHKFAQRIWRSLLKAVTEAGSREIKSSPGLKRAIAEVLNLFARLTKRIRLGNIRAASPDLALNCICDMADAVRCIQPADFTERSVTRSENGTFEIINSSPTSKAKAAGQAQSPLVALLEMISPLAHAAKPDSDGLKALESLITASIESLPNRKAKLLFLKSCAEAIYAGDRRPDEASNSVLWTYICNNLKLALEETKRELSVREHGQSLYDEYQASLSIIKRGLDVAGEESCISLTAAISRLIETARLEAGDAAALVSVVAPLSLAVICCRSHSSLDACLLSAGAMLRTSLVAPLDRTVMSAARFMLPPGQQATNWSFALLNMVNRLLHEASRRLPLESVALATFMDSLTEFSTGSLCDEPKELLIQCHIGISQCAKRASSLPESFCRLWAQFMAILRSSVSKDSRSLALHEVLFTAGFTSDSRSIAYITVQTWNTTFGPCEDLTYPSRVSELLAGLRRVAHVIVSEGAMDFEPSSDSCLGEDALKAIFPWTTTDESDVFHDYTVKTPKSLQRKPFEPVSVKALVRPSPTTSASKKESSKKFQKTPTKLRHEGSQIDFVPIANDSPMDDAGASQHLTEHQMEVRSRQETAAALFPGLESSPNSAGLSSFKGGAHDSSRDAHSVAPSPSQERSRRRANRLLQRKPSGAILEDFRGEEEYEAKPLQSEDANEAKESTSPPTPGDAPHASFSAKHDRAGHMSDLAVPSAPPTGLSVQTMQPHLSTRRSERLSKSKRELSEETSIQQPVATDLDLESSSTQGGSRRASLRMRQADIDTAEHAHSNSMSNKRKSPETKEPHRSKKRKSNQQSTNGATTADPSQTTRSGSTTKDSFPKDEADASPVHQTRSTRSNPNLVTDTLEDSNVYDAPVRRSKRHKTPSKAAINMDKESTTKRRRDQGKGNEQTTRSTGRRTTEDVAPSHKGSSKRTRTSNVRSNATEPDNDMTKDSDVEMEEEKGNQQQPAHQLSSSSETTTEYAEEETETTNEKNDGPNGQINTSVKTPENTATRPTSTPTAQRTWSFHGSQLSPPTRLTFSPAMSAKARMFLDGMKEMYRQCKALVLGVDDQGIMDEMEDVVDNVRREIGRAGRRGGVSDHSSSQ